MEAFRRNSEEEAWLRKEKIDQMKEMAEQNAECIKQEQEYADSVKISFDVASTSIDVMGGMINTVAQAFISGSVDTVHAAAEMIKGVALSLAIEAGIQGLMETAKGIADAASYNEYAAAKHFGSAATFFVTAGIASAVAAGATIVAGHSDAGGSKAPTYRAVSKGYTGDGRYNELGAPASGGGGGGGTNVTVVLEGDAAGVFRVASKGSKEAKSNGDRGFAMEN